tara:strand:+ start:805 stop:1059 length:255 start_codon:yes stop_codon:yes gene_type:complete
MVEIYVNGERVNADEYWSWDDIREMRNTLLSFTDPYMISDRFALLTESKQTELLEYRQALRDLPQTYDTIDELEFPEELDWIQI